MSKYYQGKAEAPPAGGDQPRRSRRQRWQESELRHLLKEPRQAWLWEPKGPTWLTDRAEGDASLEDTTQRLC